MRTIIGMLLLLTAALVLDQVMFEGRHRGVVLTEAKTYGQFVRDRAHSALARLRM